MVVRAHCVRRPARRRTVKEKNHSRDLVQPDEIRALPAELVRTDEITPARRQRATAARNIESVKARQPKAMREKCVSLFLKPAVGTGDHESVRALWRPLAVRVCHDSVPGSHLFG